MTSLLIQEKLPEGVNLPLGTSTVCISLKTKGHVKTTFSTTWQSYARHIFRTEFRVDQHVSYVPVPMVSN